LNTVSEIWLFIPSSPVHFYSQNVSPPNLSSHRCTNHVNFRIYCVIYISCLTRQLVAMYHLQVSSHRWQACASTEALALP